MGLMRRTRNELRALARAETPTHRRYRDHLTVSSTQLLTVSCQMRDPISFAGRALDIFMEAYAISVVAALAGATGAFIQKRWVELDAKAP